MTGYLCSEKQFLNDTITHKIDIERDDGVNRHIHFKGPGTMCGYFDLITWPGHLCITGDYGTYVFSRVRDMFEFFESEKWWDEKYPDKLFINPGYWGEKLQSISTHGGYREFDTEGFEERVRSYAVGWLLDNELTDEQAVDLWNEIETNVLDLIDDGEWSACQTVYDFEYHDYGFTFIDFFDGGTPQQYTFSYIWCLYAIAWGIQQYEKVKGEISDHETPKRTVPDPM